LKGGVPLAYGYFWWTPTTVQSQRDSAYAGSGIFGQHLYVNPKERVVIVVWSAQTRPSGGDVVNEWAFFDAVVRALQTGRHLGGGTRSRSGPGNPLRPLSLN
jgi:CubicO group peptidase (beta-lactamase class C family)